MLAQKYLDKALMITGAFEGRGFDALAGNFDGQGISAGILQWNFGQGSLQSKILKPFVAAHGMDALNKFFPISMEYVPSMSTSEGVAFAKKYMLAGTAVKAEWRKAWEAFLKDSRTIAIQKAAAASVADSAEKYCNAWGMSSERAFCWFFDIVTQNGSIKISKPVYTKALMDKAVAFCAIGKNNELWGTLRKNFSSEQDVLMIASYQRAMLSKSAYQQDVMSRKGTIAAGSGTVHGTKFNFDFSGATVPVDVSEPAPAPQPESGLLATIKTMLEALVKAIQSFLGATPSTTPTSPDVSLVDKIKSQNDAIKSAALLKALSHLSNAKVKNQDEMLLVDFTINEKYPRMFLINLKTGASSSYKCAHGSKSDPDKDGNTDKFSNVEGSNMSSIGAMVMAEKYASSKFKYARRIDGLESALNGNVRSRAVVFHSSTYVNDVVGQSIGDSLGCFALSVSSAGKLIDKVAAGMLLYAWDDSIA